MNNGVIHWPRISIVTPSYNSVRFIEDTINSVISQKYPNLEYIIIDGGSTDGTIDIIKKYESHLAAWISESDNGMYHAIQKGFEKSSGEIMAWINSDDMYHRNSLFTVADIFGSFPQVNWLSGLSTVYDESGRTVYAVHSRLFTEFDFYNHDFKWIQQESVFWRRSLWNKAGGSLNTNLKYAGDFDLWLRFLHLDNLYVTHALLGGFRSRSDQISITHKDDYIYEIEKSLSLHPLSKDKLKILRRYQKIQFLEKVLKTFRIFKTEWIIKRFKKKHFVSGKFILFDVSGKFVLAD